jgi:hypothetical protein
MVEASVASSASCNFGKVLYRNIIIIKYKIEKNEMYATEKLWGAENDAFDADFLIYFVVQKW